MSPLVPRHSLDIGQSDLAFAVASSLRERDSVRALDRASQWLPDGTVTCLSVRSGFDLLLSALALPRGSEVLMSAITIPDMARILAAHGLVAVPFDLDTGTLAPLPGALEAARTPHTRAIVFAHLFGGRTDLCELSRFAEEHRLVLIEDAAQAFVGRGSWGDPRATVTMWSFGIIKTATALGGGVCIVRDARLAARMRELHARWPFQPSRVFARRARNVLALSTVLTPRRFGALVWGLERVGRSVEDLITSSTRSFGGRDDQAFLTAIRHRPPAPLLALLDRRLATFDAARLARRAAIGARLSKHFEVLGSALLDHTHWLLPVRARDPDRFIAQLRRAGFDATRAASTLTVVAAPEGRPAPVVCRSAMAEVVYVPAYPEMDPRAEARLIAAIAPQTVAWLTPPS